MCSECLVGPDGQIDRWSCCFLTDEERSEIETDRDNEAAAQESYEQERLKEMLQGEDIR